MTGFLPVVGTGVGDVVSLLGFVLVFVPTATLVYVGFAGAIAGFWQRVYRAFRGKPTYSELVDRVAHLEDRIESLEQDRKAREQSEE